MLKSMSRKRGRRRVQCPMCDTELDSRTLQYVKQNTIVECDECGAELEVVSKNPIIVDLALPDESYIYPKRRVL